MTSPDAPIIRTVVGTGEAGLLRRRRPPLPTPPLREPFMCAFDQRRQPVLSARPATTCVRRIDAADRRHLLPWRAPARKATPGDGGPAAVCPTFHEPYSAWRWTAFSTHNGDSIYVVDRLNAAVRKIDAATGIISTVAGTGRARLLRRRRPRSSEAQMREPNDCFLDGRGNLLIADIQDQRIRRLNLTSGIIDTFAGNGEKDSRAATACPPARS